MSLGEVRNELLLGVVSHDFGLLPLPIAIFFCLAFVVQLLPLCQFYPRFHEMPLPVKGSADAGLAFLCHTRANLRQLFFMQQ